MPIYTYDVPRRQVTASDQTVVAEVRGFSFNDINRLVTAHFEDLDKLLTIWEHYVEISKRRDPKAMMTDIDFAAFIADIAMSAPAIIAHTIAIAADAADPSDPDYEREMVKAMAQISQWPMHTQCRAVGNIYALSVEDFGGPAKIVGALIQQIRQAAPAMGMIKA